MLKQPLLAIYSTAISGKGTIGTNNAMARHNDSVLGLPISSTHRTYCLWLFDTFRLFPISGGFTKWYRQ
jgi:hypothetical protein